MNARVRLRSPSPSIRATAIVVLSWKINRGTSPRKAKPPRWPSRMTGDDPTQTTVRRSSARPRRPPGAHRVPGADRYVVPKGRKSACHNVLGQIRCAKWPVDRRTSRTYFRRFVHHRNRPELFLPGPGGVVLLSTVSNHSPKCSMHLAGRDRHHRHQDSHQEEPDPELKAPGFPENHSLPNRQGVWL